MTLDTYRDHLGEVRFLGNRPRPKGFAVRATEPARVIPRSEWVEFEYGGECPLAVKDQNGKGACNGHAAASSLEGARWVAGLKHYDLSPWFIYAILCGGWDTGSSIAEALTLLEQTGAPRKELVDYATISPKRLSEDAHKDAARFRIEIASSLGTFDEVMSQIQLRRFGNFSIKAGWGFDALDSEGVCGFSGGAGNHAVTFGFGAKVAKRGRYAGQWLFKWLNSWSPAWGLNGFAWVAEEHLANQAYFDAYSVNAVEDDPTAPIPGPGV
jgi:hypothetical protein